MRKISYFYWFLRVIVAGIFILSCNREPSSNQAEPEATTPVVPATAEVPKTPLEQGKELYISYCQICHGDNADGNGPMAELLKAQPSDLTKIQARRDGVFNEEEIYMIIDGREPVVGHGSGEMPIWGQTFMNSEKLSNEAEMKAEIEALVTYLKSIQQP